MFREVGKTCEWWGILLIGGAVIGNIRGDFDDTWFGNWFMPVISILLLAWLALFAIGVTRGEPNP